MYTMIAGLLIAAATLISSTTADISLAPLPDFQVLEGSEARFEWEYTGEFEEIGFLDVDLTTAMVVVKPAEVTITADYISLINSIYKPESLKVGFVIVTATTANTGNYKIKMTKDTTVLEQTIRLTVVPLEQYDEFKKSSFLKINNDETVEPRDSVPYNVASGLVTLESTVPTDYTQTTTCTLTSSSIERQCSSSCTSAACTYNLYDVKSSDTIEIKILIDGFSDTQSYGYTLFVEEQKTALASNHQASLLDITLLVVIVWMCG